MVRKLYSFMVVTLDGFYVAEEVAKLKQQPGKGIAMMGSPGLTVSCSAWAWSTSCG